MLEELRKILEELLDPHTRCMARVEYNQRVILQGLHAILSRETDMSKIHDDIKAALAVNSSTAIEVSGKVAAVAVMKEKDDKTLEDVLSTIQSQGDVLTTMGKTLDITLGTGAAILTKSDTDAVPPLVAVTTTVAAPTSSPSVTVPVASTTGINQGDTVSGPGVNSGTTVQAVDPVASTVTLSTPTTVDHTGDGTETLTVTKDAVPAA